MEIRYIELSGREREVYNLLLAGLRNKEIADRLYLSPTTVSTHIQSIFNKRCCSSRLELMAERIQELEEEVRNVRRVQSTSI